MIIEEWFDLIDLRENIIGKAPRSICHQNPGLIHQAVHVLVFDDRHRIFLQKRSARKDIQPSKWDTSVGGHLNPGEAPEIGAEREMREELGLTGIPLTAAYKYVWRSDVETELIHAFAVRYAGPFKLDPVEIDEGRFWTLDEIRDNMDKDFFTPQFKQEFPRMVAWLSHSSREMNASLPLSDP